MKKLLTVLALGALTSVSHAQVFSPTVGFTTLNLQPGNNFVGFNLMPSMVYQGTITVDADRTKIYLTNGTITDDQFNPAVIDANNPSTHAVEIISAGANQGVNTAIVDSVATGAMVTLLDPLPGSVADGTEIRIWKLWTIGDAFGATNSAGLTSTNSANTSDLVLIPTASGGYDQFYYSAGGIPGVGWRKVGGGSANRAGFPIYFTDGFLILARTTGKTITIAGAVKPGQTTVVLETGNNFFTNLCPVNAGGATPSSEGRTLGNSNLYNGTANGLTGSSSANSADLVLLWNGTGYDQYYYSTGGIPGMGWRKVGGGATDRATVPLPDGAFLVLRRGAPTTIALSQPTF